MANQDEGCVAGPTIASPDVTGMIADLTTRLAAVEAEREAALSKAEVLTEAISELQGKLAQARQSPGRVNGLREAAELIKAAAGKEVTSRVLIGKRELLNRGLNHKLMMTVAGLVLRYADDAEAGRL